MPNGAVAADPEYLPVGSVMGERTPPSTGTTASRLPDTAPRFPGRFVSCGYCQRPCIRWGVAKWTSMLGFPGSRRAAAPSRGPLMDRFFRGRRRRGGGRPAPRPGGRCSGPNSGR